MNLADAESAVLAARQELWRRGDLKFKFHATQRKLYDLIHDKRRYFLLCSRRLGKSYLLVCLAFEYALKNPGARISYAAPTQRDATQIVNDLVVQLLVDCPDEIRPQFYAAEKEYRFPNGSVIRFSGTNAEHHENLRGRAAHLFVLDEVGQMDELNYILQSVVAPMVLTTGGRVILASTPSRSPGHDMTKIAKTMLAKGEASSFTLLDAPHITYEQKFEALEQQGENVERIPDILAGKLEPENTSTLREFWVRMDVTDADSAVVPEFTTQAQKEIVIDHERPPYFDAYVAVDPGQVDKTGGIFGYWDFSARKLVIEDEFLLSRPGTDDIALAVKEKEEQLWGVKAPLIRTVDSDLRLAKDMFMQHGIVFSQYNRQDSMGAVDAVRSLIRRREIIIAPKCAGLIRQLRNATWNRKASDWERSTEDAHFDLLACLKILVRSINRDKNPYPAWYGSPGFNSGGGNTGSGGAPKSVFSDTPMGRKFAKKWG